MHSMHRIPWNICERGRGKGVRKALGSYAPASYVRMAAPRLSGAAAALRNANNCVYKPVP